MATHNTGNPVEPNGSADPRDLYDNAKNLDIAANSTTRKTWDDRTNHTRKTYFGMESQFDSTMIQIQSEAADSISKLGWVTVDSFEDGATLTAINQVLRYKANGEFYRWDGEFRKTVSAGSNPLTSGGIGVGAWLSVGTATLAANLIKYNGVAVQRLTMLDQYSAWPQGKVFNHKGKVYCIYNVGSAHTGNDLSVYMQTSTDGLSWSAPANIVPGNTAYSAGVTAWGAGSDGTSLWMIVRYRGANYLRANTKHKMFKSTDDGATWSVVVDDLGFVDDDLKVPVLYHSFCVLPNGLLAFSYHFENGRVGVIKINPSDYTYSTSDMYTSADFGGEPVIVELTLITVGSDVIGFGRTQNITKSKPIMWRSADNCATFSKVQTDINVDLTPVSLTIYNGLVYCFWSDRYIKGSTTAGLHLGVGTLPDFLSLQWPMFSQRLICELPALDPSKSSGTGVQDVAVKGEKIVVCLSANMNNENKADVYSVTLDMSTKKDNPIIMADLFNGLTPSYSGGINVGQIKGSVNIAELGSQTARIRLNGASMLNDTGTVVQFGGTSPTLNNKPHYYYNGYSASGSNIAYQQAQIDGGDHIVRSPTGYMRIAAGSSDRTRVEITTSSIDSQVNNIPSQNINSVGATSILVASSSNPFCIGARGSAACAYLWIITSPLGSAGLYVKYGSLPSTPTDGVKLS